MLTSSAWERCFVDDSEAIPHESVPIQEVHIRLDNTIRDGLEHEHKYDLGSSKSPALDA